MNKHIIFTGFKHVGKSVIAKSLAEKLCKKFVDLDYQIELLSKKKFLSKLSCQEIMRLYGEKTFRNLETEALYDTIKLNPCIIALGGGALSRAKNQDLIKPYFIIHVTAFPGIVFERNMINGQPTFFSSKSTTMPIITFKNLWNKRKKIYQKLANFSIENDGSIEEAVEKIINKLCLNGNYG